MCSSPSYFCTRLSSFSALVLPETRISAYPPRVWGLLTIANILTTIVDSQCSFKISPKNKVVS